MKFHTMEQVANAYTKANRLKSESTRKQVKINFLSTMKNDYSWIKPEQIEFVSFDGITIVIGDELIDIEV